MVCKNEKRPVVRIKLDMINMCVIQMMTNEVCSQR
jgi:hypothetical protein